MKRVNSITRKILLFAMLLFVMHDFVIGQSDIVASKQETLQTCSYSAKPALTVGEHHVFHAPFLLTSENLTIQLSPLQNNLYSLNTLTIKEINNPLFTPPKHI